MEREIGGDNEMDEKKFKRNAYCIKPLITDRFMIMFGEVSKLSDKVDLKTTVGNDWKWSEVLNKISTSEEKIVAEEKFLADTLPGKCELPWPFQGFVSTINKPRYV